MRPNLTIIDKVLCRLIHKKTLFQALALCENDFVVVYNKPTYSALDNHNSPNNAYGESSDFSKIYILGGI